jgi:hypothetical protein
MIDHSGMLMTTQYHFSFQRIMHSVLTGRMLLQLRRYERNNIHGDGVTELLGACTPIQLMQNNITTSDDAPEDL